MILAPRVPCGTTTQCGRMTKRGTADTEAKGGIDSRRFEDTIRRMLRTPPQPHKKDKGAAAKRVSRSAGKGTKGQALDKP